MAEVRPRPFFLVAAMRKPLQIPVTQIYVQAPAGAKFRIDYMFITYPRRLFDDPISQPDPNLSFQLYDSAGRGMTAVPSDINTVLTPGGTDLSLGGTGGPYAKGGVRGMPGWGLEYDPLAVIRVDITGMSAGPLPAHISITYLGMRDRMRW